MKHVLNLAWNVWLYNDHNTFGTLLAKLKRREFS